MLFYLESGSRRLLPEMNIFLVVFNWVFGLFMAFILGFTGFWPFSFSSYAGKSLFFNPWNTCIFEFGRSFSFFLKRLLSLALFERIVVISGLFI